MTATMTINDQERSHKHVLVIAAVVVAVLLAAALSTWAIESSPSATPAATKNAPAHAAAPAAPQVPATAAPAASATPAPAASATPSFPGVPAAAVAAITTWETANGPAASSWQISEAQASAVNPAYVLFKLTATTGNEATFQPGYGFALSTGGTWTVVSYGNEDVGCPTPGTNSTSMPANVLASFGLSCSPA